MAELTINTSSVSEHPEYVAMKVRWRRNRDVCDGELAMKKRARKYIPDDNEEYINGVAQGYSKTGSQGDPYEFTRRYNNLVERASLMPFAQSTRNGWVGMAFNEDPTHNLEKTELAYLIGNVDGGGRSLKQLSKRSVSDTIEVGRYGLLVEMPTAPENASRADEERLNIKPRIVAYRAEDILDWDETKIGSADVLTFVKLREIYWERSETDNDLSSYAEEPEERFVVLRLTEKGYTQQRYDKDDKPTSDEILIRGTGGALNYIPFYFIGAENNRPDVDEAPISGIVDLNISHFRNSADEEQSHHIHSGVTLVVDTGETNATDFVKANPNMQVGNNSAIAVQKGSATLMQMEANQAISNLMRAKEERAEKVGAQFTGEGKSQNVTAEAARINAANTTNSLTTLVGNVSEAIRDALQACADIMGINLEVEYALTTEFYADEIQWQALAGVMELQQLGQYTDEGFRAELTRLGFKPDGDGVPQM